MPDRRILLIGPATNEAESLRSLELLDGLDLPNATKFVVTNGKFDAGKRARTFNAQTGYPAEPALLQTVAAWLERDHRHEPRHRDGYDLFCLRAILAKSESCDAVVILHSPLDGGENLSDVLGRIGDRLFMTLPSKTNSPTVIFNLADPRAAQFLDLLWDLYASGAVYGVAPYSLDHALMIAADAQRFAGDAGLPQNTQSAG